MTRDCLTQRAGPAPGWRLARPWTLALLAALAAIPLRAPDVGAQAGGVIAGTVVDARTLRGVDGVQLAVQGGTQGAVTDASGGFRITGLSGAQVTLTIRRIGYRPATQAVRVGQTDVRITITEQVATLSELVITGTAEPVEKRAIGNSVTKVDAATVQQIAPSRNVSGLINGRAPG
ncbi:MAG TPA: carboxypeptidase-like regulatory domain-containing protein, partial [Gemmatimonadaceae bacterium]|nr:carboxypeptidase-like regulatory domain-containing protein [Gemmatimonadaceae bacterium]